MFLIGKLRTGLVWLALITEHRLSFSSAGGGEPWPGPLGEITWSGLRPRGGMSQYDQGFASNIFIYCYLVNPFLLPRGSVHVLPLSQQTFFLSKKIFLTFINILSIFRMINHEQGQKDLLDTEFLNFRYCLNLTIFKYLSINYLNLGY